MHEFLAPLGPFLASLVALSLQAGVLVGLILAAQAALGRWLSPRSRFALWGLLVLRLLLPIVPGSPLSVWNLLPADLPKASASLATTPSEATAQLSSLYPSPSSAPNRVGPSLPSAPSTQSTINPWILLWIGGTAMTLGLAIHQNARLHRRIRHSGHAADPELAKHFDTACATQAAGRRVQLILTDAVSTPTLTGVTRPAVLIPPHLASSLTREQLGHVFAHELAHLRRHDVAANWLLIVLTAVHWFNPLIWLAVSRLRDDRELARDAEVTTRGNPTYGHTLLRVLELATPPPAHAAAVQMAAAPRALRQRLIQAAHPHPPHPKTGIALFICLALLLSACALPAKRSPSPVNHTGIPGAIRLQQATHTSTLPFKRNPRLQQRFDFDVRGVRFDETLTRISEQTGLPIEVDWDSLTRANFDQGTPISLWLTQQTTATFIQLVLQQAADSQDNSELDATWTGWAIHISATSDTTAFPPLTRLIAAPPESVRFDDFIAHCREQSGLHIEVDWPAIEAAGFDRAMPVPVLWSRKTQAGRALSFVINNAWHDQIDAYVTPDKTIHISTTLEVERAVHRYSATYDLGTYRIATSTTPTNAYEAIEQITELIQDTVGGRHQWAGSGEPLNTIRTRGNHLIIHTTAADHQQVDRLLRLVSRSQSQNPG